MEMEDEEDPEDFIVGDYGFMHRWKFSDGKLAEYASRPKVYTWGVNAQTDQNSLIQTEDDVQKEQVAHKVEAPKMAMAQTTSKAKFSDEIADGTTEDDLTVDDMDDSLEENVDENMMQVADSLY